MGIWDILQWLAFGLIVGAVARLIMPGKQNMSVPMTAILGIVGSFAGGALWSVAFSGATGLMRASGWIMSIVGALLVLFAYSMLAKGK